MKKPKKYAYNRLTIPDNLVICQHAPYKVTQIDKCMVKREEKTKI